MARTELTANLRANNHESLKGSCRLHLWRAAALLVHPRAQLPCKLESFPASKSGGALAAHLPK